MEERGFDPWRRKFERLNKSRRPARPAEPRIRFWGMAALILGGGIAIWFLLQERTHSLRAEEATAMTETDISSDETDAAALFRAEKFAEALPLLLPLAEDGVVPAQCMVGKILSEGRGGIAIDLIEGTKWLDLCVRDPAMDPETADDEARDILRRLTDEAGWAVVGEGKYRAFQWQQAIWNSEIGQPGSASEEVLADLPNLGPDQAFALGVALNQGDGYPVDFAKAFAAFKRAADGGIAEAMFNVGLSYYAGKGVRPDPMEARRWLDRSVEAGFGPAATLLGAMAARGDGMPADEKMAHAYFKRAAALGDDEARLLLEAVGEGEN